MKNKKLFVGAAVLLGVSLTACGGASKGANTTTSQAEKAAGTSESTTAANSSTATSGEKPTVSIMLPDVTGNALSNENSDKVIQMIEDHTGVKVDWRWEQDSTFEEKFGLTLMDRDNMPMILTGKRDITANVVDAARKGAFWDLTPFLEDSASYPNLSQYNKNTMKAMTVDGKIIALYRGREVGRFGLTYRTDWAEKVGITKTPETVEDVYDMMYKFTYNDPDGNGKQDTYGLEMTKYTGPLDIIQTWFGCGNEWVDHDGKLIPVHQTSEYREALKWMRKIYEEGLIRKDWAAVDSGTFSDALKKGEAGVFVDVQDSANRIWRYYMNNKVPSAVDSSKLASMTTVGPIAGKTLATSGYNGYFLITKAGAKTEEDVKNCLHFLDKMCDDEMLVLGDYGLEGIDWNLNDKGEIVKTNALNFEKQAAVGINGAFCYIPNSQPTEPKIYKDEPTIAQEEGYAKSREVAVVNPALGYLVSSEVNAEVGTDIEQIIDDARTQYICGQIDDAGFDAAAQTWLDRGGDRLIEDINKMYQADKK